MKYYQKKSYLEEEYVNKRRSIRDIADDCGVSHPTIHRHMRLLGVPTRSRIESVSRVKEKKPRLTAEELESKKRGLLGKLTEQTEELRKLENSLKYPLTEAEAQQNRRVESGKRSKEESAKRKREIAFGNKVAEDVWHGDEVGEQMDEIQERFGGKI